MSEDHPPVRRFGLEQELFVVDESATLKDEADHLLERCRAAAVAAGLDPGCFKGECVESLVEVTTPPCSSFDGLVASYLDNLNLALTAARELGLMLYPLATYPLPTTPVVRDEPRYRLKARVVGDERFLHAGRCAGVHLHVELPPGTVSPDVRAARRALPDVRRELLNAYNLATALDPALVALTRACPFYEGRLAGLAARTARYRGIFGVDGVYAGVPEAGTLQPYAGSVEDLIRHQEARHRAWLGAMNAAGVDRGLFAASEDAPSGAAWNPVRLNPVGTLEIRSLDGNYPEVILPVVSLVLGAADRVRTEVLEVRPAPGVRSFEAEGDRLLVPDFAGLSGELLHLAVTRGAEDPRLKAYLDSFVEFATRGEKPGPYRTTETGVLRAFPPSGSSIEIERERGLRLAREACRELERQVSTLRRERSPAVTGGRGVRQSPGRYCPSSGSASGGSPALRPPC